jgi:uncharacterized protein
MSPKGQTAGDPVLFDVTVVPRAGRAGVEKTGDRAYRVRVTSPPEGGRANRDVLRLLAELWGVPPSSLSVVRGETSRRKTVACRDPRMAG